MFKVQFNVSDGFGGKITGTTEVETLQEAFNVVKPWVLESDPKIKVVIRK